MSPGHAYWIPPPTNVLKINVDSSFLRSKKLSSLAAICRDHKRRWVGGVAMRTCCTDPQEAETRAILMGLEWVKANGWRSVIISSDCKNAIKDISSNSNIKSNICDVVHVCKELLQESAGHKLIHEGRDSNRVADKLAKYVIGRTATINVLQIFSSPPSDCMNLVDEEAKNWYQQNLVSDDHG